MPEQEIPARKEKTMTNLKHIETEDSRNINGGGRYFCKVCGYSNNNYSKVFTHCARHVDKWVPRWARWSRTVINIMKNF